MSRLTNKKSIARAVRDIIVAEERWNQFVWLSVSWFDNFDMQATGSELRKLAAQNVCDTTACVAGHTVILTLPGKAKYDYVNDVVIMEDGTDISVHRYARRALGLDAQESDWLFSAHRRKDQVLAALDLIIEGKSLDSLIDG